MLQPVTTDVERAPLTRGDLLAILSYHPASGVFTWRVTRGKARAGSPAGWVALNGYIYIGWRGADYLAHRLAWFYAHGYWPKELDHRNGKTTDNRLRNLREATRGENNQNRRLQSNSTTGYVGVSWSKQQGKFRARIVWRGHETHLGFYDRAEDAAAAYIAGKRRIHSFAPKLRTAAP